MHIFVNQFDFFGARESTPFQIVNDLLDEDFRA